MNGKHYPFAQNVMNTLTYEHEHRLHLSSHEQEKVVKIFEDYPYSKRLKERHQQSNMSKNKSVYPCIRQNRSVNDCKDRDLRTTNLIIQEPNESTQKQLKYQRKLNTIVESTIPRISFTNEEVYPIPKATIKLNKSIMYYSCPTNDKQIIQNSITPSDIYYNREQIKVYAKNSVIEGQDTFYLPIQRQKHTAQPMLPINILSKNRSHLLTQEQQSTTSLYSCLNLLLRFPIMRNMI